MWVFFCHNVPMKILFLLLFVLACSSHKKTAMKLSDKNHYEEALPHWIAAFKDDPKDEEVRDGLKDCQEKVFNERLVKIRNLRLANNHDQAVADLKNLMKTQTEWGLSTDINSSTFQGNEVKSLWVKEKDILKETADKNFKPLKAYHRFKLYEDVFHSRTDRHEVEAFIKVPGLKLCGQLNKDLSPRPYYRTFVKNLCGVFGKKITFKKPVIKKEQFLYSVLQLKNLDLKGEGDIEVVAENKMKKAFELSPWYSEKGLKKGVFLLTGSFGCTHNQYPIQQQKDYTVEIPYTAYVEVNKTRRVPYTDYAGKTQYQTEGYVEQEPRTRYRTEPRSFAYTATKKDQKCLLELNGDFEFDGKKTGYLFLREEAESVVMHDISMPNIGLYPATEDVHTPVHNFMALTDLASTEFEQNLNQAWISRFCKDENPENIIRCTNVKNFPTVYVNNWFTKEFGVTYPEAKFSLGEF